MKLLVLERIQLLNVLPKEGDFSTLKIIRGLQNELSFSEEEHKILQFKNGGETYIQKDKDGKPVIGKDKKPVTVTVPLGQLHWEKDIDKDVQIGEKTTDIIAAEFKKLSEQKKLNMGMLDLYEKFVEVK